MVAAKFKFRNLSTDGRDDRHMSHAKAVLPTIYRSLLRLGRQLDKNPLSKALLIVCPFLSSL